MSLSEIQAADRRLIILRLLAAEPDYASNGAIIQSALNALGHGASTDRVNGDLAWLEEQDLIGVDIVVNDVRVARLTGRGMDVSKGHAYVPGVRRPNPGE